MNRRIRSIVGVAVGGLLAAAFLPVAVALADDYTLVPESQEVDTSVTGFPPLYEETIGTAQFGAENPGMSTIFGVFNADVTTFTTSSGFDNQEIVDTGGQLGGLTVPTGSIFDFTNFGGGFENEYSDIDGTVGTVQGPDIITDTFITPFGDFNIPTTFDAIDVLSMPSAFIP